MAALCTLSIEGADEAPKLELRAEAAWHAGVFWDEAHFHMFHADGLLLKLVPTKSIFSQIRVRLGLLCALMRPLRQGTVIRNTPAGRCRVGRAAGHS